jgi:hypothetical protein
MVGRMARIKKGEDVVDRSRRQRLHGCVRSTWGGFIVEEAWYIYQNIVWSHDFVD